MPTDRVERKLTDLEDDFDSAWKHGVSIGEQLKLDLLGFVIVGAFYFLSWFFLFAIFLIPSAIGALFLNLKFLIWSFQQGSVAIIFLRVILSVVAIPAYILAVYVTVSSYLS